MRTNVNISMPESLRLYMLKRAKESSFGSVSEYIRDLIRADQQRYLAKMDAAIDRDRQYFLQKQRLR